MEWRSENGELVAEPSRLFPAWQLKVTREEIAEIYNSMCVSSEKSTDCFDTQLEIQHEDGRLMKFAAAD